MPRGSGDIVVLGAIGAIFGTLLLEAYLIVGVRPAQARLGDA